MTLWRVTRPLRRGLRRCFRWGCYGTLAAAALSLTREIPRAPQQAAEKSPAKMCGRRDSAPENVEPKPGKERII